MTQARLTAHGPCARRGKSKVGHYVTQHLEAVDAASMPCRLQGLIQDIENNHLLKAGPH